MLKIAIGRSVVILLCLGGLAAPARADTIWADWMNFTGGTAGSASGSLGGIGVMYTGELVGAVVAGTSPIWAPDSSFIGGTVTTSPNVTGDDLRLNGRSTGTNTITFASPITNPVFAIWSLGSPSVPATFTFDATPTFQAGGPNSFFAGSPIAVAGNMVSGQEGNGVVQFNGTFTSIAFTNSFENFYAFTVGANGEPSAPVPEPASMLLFGSGLAAVALRHRRNRPDA
jgi:hypothetical protein